MTSVDPAAPAPAFSGAISVDQLLADQPPELDVDTNFDEIKAGRRVVFLDDDPTGTQTITDLPVLTSWSVGDVRWALQQPTTGFFILTNTRSLFRIRRGGPQPRGCQCAAPRQPTRSMCPT